MWLSTIWHFLIIISPDIWTLIDGPFLPDKIKTCIFILAMVLLMCANLKTDFLLIEINGGLDTFKIFYILKVNIKSIYQLNDKNYNRLASSSRIIITLFIDYCGPLFSILTVSCFLIFTILSKRLYWWIYFILFAPSYFGLVYIIEVSACIIYIYLPYYSIRFDQLNEQIKSFLNGKSKIIFQKRKTY